MITKYDIELCFDVCSPDQARFLTELVLWVVFISHRTSWGLFMEISWSNCTKLRRHNPND